MVQNLSLREESSKNPSLALANIQKPGLDREHCTLLDNPLWLEY